MSDRIISIISYVVQEISDIIIEVPLLRKIYLQHVG